MKITVYAVWTLEDSDYVDMFLSKEEAEECYESYGEFGGWAEQTFDIGELNEHQS